MKKKAGFAILGMMIIVWTATLVGYGIHEIFFSEEKTVQTMKDNTVYNRR